MSKEKFMLIISVVILTGANILLWLNLVQGGPAPRAGRIMGLIIMLAVGALFADKFSNNPYAPGFIRLLCLAGMTVLFFILYNQ